MLEIQFKGQKVLVVGGSSGIGNGIAQSFRTAGAAVQVWGTRPDAASYKDDAGCDLQGLDYHQCDVANLSAVRDCAGRIDELDVLVLCQGAVRYGREEFEPEVFREVTEINLSSLMSCAKSLLPALQKRRGAVVIISSLAGFASRIGNPAYAASKAGAISLTKTLGEAWARDGVRVNGVAPGLVPSKLTTITTDDPERAKKVLRGIPAGRFGRPQDIANAVLFLASPLASYVIGQTLLVDGGKGLS